MTDFDPSSYHVGFVVVDKLELGRVLSEYIGFPANLHSTNCFPHSATIQSSTLFDLVNDSVVK
jgi:hypothetical protein